MKQNVEHDYDELIIEYRNSGDTLKNWCSEHGVTESAMKYHMYKGRKKKAGSLNSLSMMPRKAMLSIRLRKTI